MFKLSFEEIVDIISKEKDLDKAHILRKIKEKVKELSGLISKEGAAHIVANELGINLVKEADQKMMKLKNLIPGLRSVSISGRVNRVFPVRTFERHGKQGKVASFIVSDGSAEVRIVLWDHRVGLVEKGQIKTGYIVSVYNAFVKEGRYGMEVHLKDRSKLQVQKAPPKSTNSIKDLTPKQHTTISATIVKVFSNKLVFYMCSNCRKTFGPQESCPEHKDTSPKPSGVVNIIVDDGSARIRCVLFGNLVEKLLGKTIPELAEELKNNKKPLRDLRPKIIGKEVRVSGNVKLSSYDNRMEIVVENFSFEDPVEKASHLLSKAEQTFTSTAS